MGNPWLFEEIAARMDGKSYRLPDLDVRLAEALTQVDDMVADKGERVGVLEARRQLAYYIKGVSGAAEARNRLNAAETLEEIHEIARLFLKNDSF
jgi:tRNA-dihydrouridine synthase